MTKISIIDGQFYTPNHKCVPLRQKYDAMTFLKGYIYLIINVLNTRQFNTPKEVFWGIIPSWGNN
jgi:hypothetical protein